MLDCTTTSTCLVTKQKHLAILARHHGRGGLELAAAITAAVPLGVVLAEVVQVVAEGHHLLEVDGEDLEARLICKSLFPTSHDIKQRFDWSATWAF